MSSPSRVVIVGAGFGGVWCARALKGSTARVTLVDRHAYHTFFPLLYQVGAAELGPTAITHPVRSLLRGTGVTFRRGTAVGLDLEGRRLRLADGWVPYDQLILAPGSSANFFGVEGAERFAFPMRTMPEALRLRRQILECFERATVVTDAQERAALLTFVVVGGGATGVEYAGALAELVRGALHPDYPTIPRREPRILLLEAGTSLLPGMGERLSRYADERLRDRGVSVRFGAQVARVEPDRVRLVSGNEIATRSVVWTAGVRGDPALSSWGLPVGRGGRIPVTATLQVEGHSEIFAIGDVALLEQDGRPLPQVAQTAMQQGAQAGRNVRLLIEGRPLEAFRYRDLGMMAVIGRNAAVADMGGRSFTGWIAWVLWLVVHLVKLIGFRNRALVLVNWAWNYLTFPRSVRLVVPTERGEERPADPPPRASPSASVDTARPAARDPRVVDIAGGEPERGGERATSD